jgi:FkbM family methyltransferase
VLAKTPLGRMQVTVRKGLAKGARWTLLPYSAYWRGDTEQDVDAAIRLHGGLRGNSCWDLGTHFGIYTVGMAMAVGPEGEVAGFEPDPVSFERCRLHVEMNSLRCVKLFNAAAGRFEGSAKLIVSQGSGASTSHFAYHDETVSADTETVSVSMIVLDHLIEKAAIRAPQFVKVDVEGHAASALNGARETIAAHHPNLAVSFHGHHERNGVKALLKPLGYRCYSCTGVEIGWDDYPPSGTAFLSC